MKKLTILLLSIFILTSCSSSFPKQVKSPTQQTKSDSKSYDWQRWDCYDYYDTYVYLFTIGYIPELNNVGKLFLKDTKTPIDTTYKLIGVQHYWNWEQFQIVIESNGKGKFYNNEFLEERYECKSLGFVSFS